MRCVAETCAECLEYQWYKSTPDINSLETSCQWCLESSTCLLSNATSCSGSNIVNFEKQICPDLSCSLNSISTSPYICSRSGIATFLIAIMILLITGVLAFYWRRSSKAKDLRKKLNATGLGEEGCCHECGDICQGPKSLCGACARHLAFTFFMNEGAMMFGFALWYIVLAPGLTSSILLPFLIIVGAIMALGLLARYNYSSETYMTPNEDIESHEKSAFGLTSISTAELRDCVAREISKESQTIHFVLEKILPCNNVVVERHGGFLVAVFSTSVCIALISDWANPLARALLPVVVLGLAGCCIFLSWRHRKHAVVLTSKKLIVVQSLAKRVNINRVNLSDIQSIDVVKWTDSEYFGNVKVTKKDRTILVLNRVPSVVDFEAALGQNQFEGKLDPRESWKIGFWLFLGGFLLIEVQHIVLLLVQGHWVYYFSMVAYLVVTASAVCSYWELGHRFFVASKKYNYVPMTEQIE